MAYTRIKDLEKDQLFEHVQVIKKKLERKKNELTKTKIKLLHTKERLSKLKEVVQYQQDRILELHRKSSNVNF
ncbi:MAG TPA: hypothetical protein PLJ13_14685 [Cyclobacteriaceae bacterium]|nr:hypothetical protein [Cyclobacteriaceae bacterium]